MEQHARKRPDKATCLHLTLAGGREPCPLSSSSLPAPQQAFSSGSTPAPGLACGQLACLHLPVAASHGSGVTPWSEEGKSRGTVPLSCSPPAALCR